jgi:hypothetical protein
MRLVAVDDLSKFGIRDDNGLQAPSRWAACRNLSVIAKVVNWPG